MRLAFARETPCDEFHSLHTRFHLYYLDFLFLHPRDMVSCQPSRTCAVLPIAIGEERWRVSPSASYQPVMPYSMSMGAAARIVGPAVVKKITLWQKHLELR